MSRRSGWILVAAVAALALGAATVGAVALLMRGSDRTVFGGPGYLQVTLGGSVPEDPPPDLGSMFGRQQLSLRALVRGIDRAASDPEVEGLLIRLHPLQTGWGRVQELRDAITRFRESGKPAVAHLEYAGNREYYLATACSKIVAVPTALLDVSGLAVEIMFFAGTLDKVGVEAEFEGVGEYKNAPNQFTEAGFTEHHREQMDALLDALSGQYEAGIAEGRGLSREAVAEIIDGGPWDAPRALEAGLIDELGYRDEIDARFAGSPLGLGRYATTPGFQLGGRRELALVYAVGDIVSGRSSSGAFGSFAGSDTIAAALREAREDSDVAAIVLRVDSPGGSGTASDVIWREVKLATAVKPVVVSMGDSAASGGYYIAMEASAIVAQPNTITGSIGVFGGKLSMRELYDKLGITKEVLTRGRHADMFSDYRTWTDDERAHVRELMTAFYEDFVTRAAQGRGLTYEDVDAVARGRVWTGAEALERGLVDELGGLDHAIALAKQKAGIPAGEAVTLRIVPAPKTFWETLVEDDTTSLAAQLPAELRAAARLARVMEAGQLLRLPFELTIR